MLHEAANSKQLVTRNFLLREESVNNKHWVHCLLSKIAGPDNKDQFEVVVFDISIRVAR